MGSTQQSTNTTCPFCLKSNHELVGPCPNSTNLTIPEDFTEYDRMWLLTVGFTKHGKTVFLSALTLVLQEISAIWDRFNYKYLDEYTKNTVRQMKYEARTGEPAPATSVGQPQPMLIRLRNLPKVGARNAVIYDVAGELFKDENLVKEYAPAIKFVQTIWFFISLNDLYSEDSLDTLHDLFIVYAEGMRKLGASLRGRTMIVVYTKADQRNFDETIDSYLKDDPLSELTNRYADVLPTPDDFNWEKYVKELRESSRNLRAYTERRLRGGRQFINSAEDEGMKIEFCLTSALGTNPGDDGRMVEEATRFRVIDPFIWSLLVHAEPPDPGIEIVNNKKRINLVLDSSKSGDAIYSEQLPSQLNELLEAIGYELRTFYLGQSKIVTHWGQVPPDQMARTRRPRLVGPILEQLSPSDGQVLIIANEPPRDLNDFKTPEWRKRILLVTLAEDETDEWEQFHFRSSTDLPPLVNTIKRVFVPGR